MTDINTFLKFKDLANRYADLGLFIRIEFDEYGMIFRGYWMNPITLSNTLNLNRRYTYEFLKNLSDEIDIEFLIDEFKNEFMKKKAESEDKE